MGEQATAEKSGKLLLHVCCAPCAAAAVREELGAFEIAAFYYNPNIHPREEYNLRLSHLRAFAEHLKLELIEGRYDPRAWKEAVKGLEGEPEGGKRCLLCYRIRILETAKEARKLGIGYIATTLSAGSSKKAEIVNAAGEEAARVHGLSFLPGDFKKKGGQALALETCRKMGIYRQNYCGCVFSNTPRQGRPGNR